MDLRRILLMYEISGRHIKRNGGEKRRNQRKAHLFRTGEAKWHVNNKRIYGIWHIYLGLLRSMVFISNGLLDKFSIIIIIINLPL